MSSLKRVSIFLTAFALLYSFQTFAAKRALVIGIGDYPHVSKLKGPKDDAYNIKALLLSEFGFQQQDIKLLIDEQATRARILNSIESWLVKGTKPGDEVVFYMSSHGFQRDDENGDEADGKDEALAPYDAKLVDKQVVNMITDDEIDLAFSNLNDRAITMIIDSCHSGTLTRGVFPSANSSYEKTIPEFNALIERPSKNVVNAHRSEVAFLESSKNRTVWSAVSAWQKALVDFESGKGSVFTNYFIKGIKEKQADANNDGEVSRSELLSYIRGESTAFCERNKRFCKTGLTPTLETSQELFVASTATFSTSVAETDHSLEILNYIDQALASPMKEEVILTLRPLKHKYLVNDPLNIHVSANASGYLLVLDIDQTGKVAQLYPQTMDELKTKGFVEQGSNVSFRGKAALPSGEGMVVALLTADNALPVDLVTGVSKDLIIETPQTYIQEVVASLSSPWQGENRNRAVNWSVSKIKYEITE